MSDFAPLSRFSLTRFASRAAWIAWLVCLFACSRSPEPPRGLPGLAFGDPPPADVTPVAVPLPHELAGVLAFYTRPGRVEPLPGLVLADPVLAFHQGRFFSVSAELDEPTASRARESLTRDFGPAYCREAAGAAVCLWRLGAVDAVLERPVGGAARFMLRYRPVADIVSAATSQATAREREGSP
jgi:hypothetical protein